MVQGLPGHSHLLPSAKCLWGQREPLTPWCFVESNHHLCSLGQNISKSKGIRSNNINYDKASMNRVSQIKTFWLFKMFNWTFKRFSLISGLESTLGAGLSNYAIRQWAANCLLSLTETVKLLFTMQINVNKNNWLHISQTIKLTIDDAYCFFPLN